MPNFLMGLVTGAGIQGLMMLSGGYFRLPNDLPTFPWRYPLYFISFHKYAFQGLYKNEFTGLRFPIEDGKSYINGEEILKEIWEVEMGYSKWVDLGVLFGMVVVYRILFFGVLKSVEKFKFVMKKIMSVNPFRRAENVVVIPADSKLDGDDD